MTGKAHLGAALLSSISLLYVVGCEPEWRVGTCESLCTEFIGERIIEGRFVCPSNDCPEDYQCVLYNTRNQTDELGDIYSGECLLSCHTDDDCPGGVDADGVKYFRCVYRTYSTYPDTGYCSFGDDWTLTLDDADEP